MTIIAIDPGQSGGYAVSAPKSYWCEKMPETFNDFADQIREVVANAETEVVAVVEDIPKFCGPKLPGSSIFVMAESFGVIQGILAALRIRTVMVRPQAWQKGFGLGTKSQCSGTTEWKQKLKAESQRRFPTLKVTNATADALLILEWARAGGVK